MTFVTYTARAVAVRPRVYRSGERLAYAARRNVDADAAPERQFINEPAQPRTEKDIFSNTNS